MPALLDSQLASILDNDRYNLEHSRLPIVTVSASAKQDLMQWYGIPIHDSTPDVVFSRAHFSMALAVSLEAWGKKIDPDQAWMTDPTNYVTHKHWRNIMITELVGQTIARYNWLKSLKDVIDRFGRQKLPILTSITMPLLYLFQRVEQPILSLHIAAGNILADQGKKIVQVITDPHVRSDYLVHAHHKNMIYCVFDEWTKVEFLEKAATQGIKTDPNRIIVTGPPVDPRVVRLRRHKQPWRSGPLKLCITTGGLGTNKSEIKTVLEQLLPLLRKRTEPIQLLVYAGTHEDIHQMVIDLAKQEHIKIGPLSDLKAELRVIYHPHIVESNELLIHHGLAWADGFITKPSGDMAYDAAAAGCFLLTLSEWGDWEHNIRQVFEQKNIGRKADVHHIVEQLTALMATHGRSQSWIEKAMNEAHQLEPLFLKGSQTIVKTALEYKWT